MTLGLLSLTQTKKNLFKRKFKYKTPNRKSPEYFKSIPVSLEEMSDAIAGNVDNNVQLDILESFIAYSEIASKLSRLFRAINTDSSNISASLLRIQL